MPQKLARIFRRQLSRSFETGKVVVFEYDLPFGKEDRYYEARLVAVSDDLALGMVRNITEQVTAAESKQRLLEQLQRAQKMEAIGMLAGGVAHDLNNVLSGVVSYPELLLMDLPEDSPLRQPIQTIQKSGERAAHIVQDLLTLARRGVSVSEIVNLNQIVRGLFEQSRMQETEGLPPRHPIDTGICDDLLNISGSPIHLTKTVMNLVSNAAEATTGDGVVRIETRNRTIDTPIDGYDDIEKGDYVVLTVKDNGIGISEEDIDRIFEPFLHQKSDGPLRHRSGEWRWFGGHRQGSSRVHRHFQHAGSGHHSCHSICRQPGHTGCNPGKKKTLESLKGNGERILVVDRRGRATGRSPRKCLPGWVIPPPALPMGGSGCRLPPGP